MIANWFVTRRCNLSCAHCCNARSRRTWPADADTAAALQIADRLVAGGVSHVLLIGGEPATRCDLVDIVERLRGNGIHVWITTNAIGMAPWIIDRLADLGVVLAVSLDGGTAPVNDAIRGRGTFQAAMRTAEQFRRAAQASGSGANSLQFSYTLMRRNAAVACDFLRCVAPLQPEAVAFLDLIVGNGARTHGQRLTPQETLHLSVELALLAESTGVHLLVPLPPRALLVVRSLVPGACVDSTIESRCAAGLHACTVTADGRLVPCGAGRAGRGPESSSLLDRSFRDIYFSYEFARFVEVANDPGRTAMLDEVCRKCVHLARRECQPECLMGLRPASRYPELCRADATLFGHRAAFQRDAINPAS